MFGENHCSEISLDIILLVLLSLQPRPVIKSYIYFCMNDCLDSP